MTRKTKSFSAQFYLPFFVMAVATYSVRAEMRDEQGRSAKGRPSAPFEPTAPSLPDLRVTNCPTFLYPSLTGQRLYEWFAVQKDVPKACAFSPPSAEEDIVFQNENWNSTALPKDYKAVGRLFEQTDQLNFKYSNPGTHGACLDKYLPSGSSESDRRRAATLSTYIIETNDSNQKQLIRAISSLDALMGDTKGIREACNTVERKDRLHSATGNPDLSERGRVWCRQSTDCAAEKGVSRRPLIEQLLSDFPKFQLLEQQRENYYDQCLKDNELDPEVGRAACGQLKQVKFQENLASSGLLASSPLLGEPDFVTELQELKKRGGWNSKNVDDLAVRYLDNQRTAMVKNLRRVSVQGKCLTTNNADFISLHKSLTPPQDNWCDPGRIMDDTAESSDEFPAELKDFPPFERRFSSQGQNELEAIARATASQRKVVGLMIQARQCLKAKKHDYEQGDLVFNTAFDLVTLGASAGTSAIVKGGRLLTKQGWIARAAKVRNLIKGTRFTYKTRLAAARLRMGVTAAGSLRDSIRSMGPDCQSPEYVRAIEHVLSDPISGVKCQLQVMNVMDDPKWMTCLEGLVGALGLGGEAIDSVRDYRRFNQVRAAREEKAKISKLNPVVPSASDQPKKTGPSNPTTHAEPIEDDFEIEWGQPVVVDLNPTRESLSSVLKRVYGNQSEKMEAFLFSGSDADVQARLKILHSDFEKNCAVGLNPNVYKRCVDDRLTQATRDLNRATDPDWMRGKIENLVLCKDKEITDGTELINVLLLLSKNLTSKGINHSIQHDNLKEHPRLVIEGNGTRRFLMGEKSGYRIAVDPGQLCQGGAGGQWSQWEKLVYVPLAQILDGKKVDLTTYHELRHYLSDKNRRIAKQGREGFLHAPEISHVQTRPWIEERLGFTNPYREFDGNSRHDEILAREKEADALMGQAFEIDHSFRKTVSDPEGDYLPVDQNRAFVDKAILSDDRIQNALQFIPMEEKLHSLLLSDEALKKANVAIDVKLENSRLEISIRSLAKVEGQKPEPARIVYPLNEPPKNLGADQLRDLARRVARDHLADVERTKQRLQIKSGMYTTWLRSYMTAPDLRRLHRLVGSIDARRDSIDKKLEIQKLILACFGENSKVQKTERGGQKLYRRSVGNKAIVYSIRTEKRRTGEGKLVDYERIELLEFQN